EGGPPPRREELQEAAQAREVLVEIGRKLEEQRPELAAHRLGRAQEIVELLGYVGQSLLVRDALGGLQDEDESIRGLRRPAGQQVAVRHPVEGVVDLDGGEALGVEAQHLRLLHLLRIERALPLLVAVAARPDQNPHVDRLYGASSQAEAALALKRSA